MHLIITVIKNTSKESAAIPKNIIARVGTPRANDVGDTISIIGRDISTRARTSNIINTKINDKINVPTIKNKGGPIITNKIIVINILKILLFLPTYIPLF